MKECPKCHLLNAEGAARCDCGYEFHSGFCSSCGKPLDVGARFCPGCGASTGAAVVAAGPAAAVPSVAYTPPQPSGYGGFWLRFAAFVIDFLVVGAACLAVSFVIGPLVILVNLTAPWLYAAYFESSEKQATLGKQAMGLRVTDETGRRISFGRATGRHFGKIVSALILFIGYIMAGFTARKQALHDMIAGTLVVRA